LDGITKITKSIIKEIKEKGNYDERKEIEIQELMEKLYGF
jgi:hypothetical protein